MTVSYTNKVATSRGSGGCFLKLLKRWKGSIYKIVWSDLLIYLFIYYTLSLSYNYVMPDNCRIIFKEIVEYFGKYGSLIPLSFVLGFFVDLVMERWWNQYSSIPFPDSLAVLVGASVKGKDQKSRAIKRTIVRYACVTFTITLSLISPKVKKRFPTLDHLNRAGLLTKEEMNIMKDLDDEYPNYTKYWLPMAWASNIVITARQQGQIRDDECVEQILSELNDFRNKCCTLLDYDWISIPLVYTQVVTIAVYSYFIISVIGNQNVDDKESILKKYFPIVPVLEFFFYMGWLKVAETLINPFGDDDDDFDVMWMIDRNVQVSYLMVDKIPATMPKLTKDPYWNKTVPERLPFTKASEAYMEDHPCFSTDNMKVSNEDQEFLLGEHPEKTKFEGNQPSGSAGPLLSTSRTLRVPKKGPIILRSVVSGNNTDNEEFDEVSSDEQSHDESQCDEFKELSSRRRDQYKERLMQHYSTLSRS